MSEVRIPSTHPGASQPTLLPLPPLTEPLEDASRVARLFHALDSSFRINILILLQEKDHCVQDIVEKLNGSQPLISQHLKLLKEAGLIESNRQGRFVYYSLKNRQVLELVAAAVYLTAHRA